MELTPKVFDDVEFRERFRGYDPDEVDAFLEQVARAVQELDQKLKDSQVRAEKAEERAREAGDADEALRRTLVLAQRTADAAVSEAETRAAALLAEAEGRAATTIADAERQAAVSRGEAEAYALRTRGSADEDAAAKVADAEGAAAEMLADAERNAREGAEDLRQRLRTEVSALEALRERLRTDAGRLEGHIAIQRQRVLATVEALQHITADPDALREAPVPEFGAIDVPPTAEAMGGGGPPAPPAPPPAVHAADDVDTEAADDESEDVTVDAAAGDEVVVDGEAEGSWFEDDAAGASDRGDVVEAGAVVEIEGGYLDVEDEITGEFPAVVIEELEASEGAGDGAEPAEQTSMLDVDGGPPTMEVPAPELLDDDDPYIAELRRAIVDPSPLGPRDDFEPDDAMADFYGRELEDSRWKGLRRRR
jgi:DivIVA domain-containing protein